MMHCLNRIRLADDRPSFADTHPLPQFLELLALIRMPRRIGIVGIGHYPRLSSHAIGSRFPSFSRIGTKTRTR